MHFTHNEGKYEVAERFVRTLKNKICKYMTSVSKNMNINKLTDIVNECNECNNKCHSTIKMKPTGAKPCTYFCVEHNYKNPKFEITVKTFLHKATLQIGLKKFL